MKKLVLAISGVFCLQLGFIAYHSSDPAAETSFLVVDEQATDRSLKSNVVEPFVGNGEIAEFDPDSLDETPETYEIERSFYPRPDSAPQTARYVARKRPALNTFVSQNTADDLRPVSVTYNVYQPVEFKTRSIRPRTEYPRAIADQAPQTYEMNAKIASKPKKKNFFGKTLAVVKKPYDWLKAVGSTIK
ncbi:MAG TPA: hypothetical protein PLP21_04095 [Pyrinomonadaceae bacterium]|nr:hypothetical protein [Acidobacteriota bacterium]HQZ95473.1 hypothetical protein [Pyrinomonadaceae bacterium]